MSIWAPVVAALGASFLTGTLGFGTIWWQQRRRDRAAAAAGKSDAYYQMIAESLSFTIRARALRDTMRVRSGLKEGFDVTLRFRSALDPLAFHDWLAQGFEPINHAWSKIQLTGSAEAVSMATALLDACADVVGLATEPGKARGRVATAFLGLEWTAEQHEALAVAVRRVVEHRSAFVRIARSELGNEPVLLRLEATGQQAEGEQSATIGTASRPRAVAPRG